jgi:hypothetical protein
MQQNHIRNVEQEAMLRAEISTLKDKIDGLEKT